MSENTPLLSSTDPNTYVDTRQAENSENTQTSPLHLSQSSSPQTPVIEEESLKPLSFKDKRRQFLRRRFWWFCIFGVLALIVLQLSFLPRTSVNRDFRRWHDLHLTKTDLKRIFLAQLKIGRPDDTGVTNEEHIAEWLRKFTTINSRHGAIVADGYHPELALFVDNEFAKMGFSTRSYEFDLPEGLKSPQSARIELLDSKSRRVLYAANLEEKTDFDRFKHQVTPSFFPFTSAGSVTGEFVFVNGGSPKDFALLEENNISFKNKIALISSEATSEYSVTDRVDYALLQGCSAVLVFGSKDTPLVISRNYKPADVPEPQIRLPASYRSVEPILEALGPATGNFTHWKVNPVSNSLCLTVSSESYGHGARSKVVIGSLKGVMNDAEIIIGASRDSLTSVNPNSGHAVMLEVMRAFQRLRKLGWKPLRTIKFISWDSSRSSQLGAKAALSDPKVFAENMPLLAYINLDGDVVTGSHFDVDSNPLTNHIIKQVASIVPFSKNSTAYRRVTKPKTEGAQERDDGDDDDDDDDQTSLYRYWRKESGANINNVLGDAFIASDAGVFQFGADTPVINLKFSESKSHNESTYNPESDYYSYKWLRDEQIDPNFDLHGTLVRFLGLLILSLEEREVVDYRLEPYFEFAQERFALFREVMCETLKEWESEKVDTFILEKTSILKDILEKKKSPAIFNPGFWGHTDDEVTVGDVLNQFEELLKDASAQALIFDAYNHDVENLLTEDYPWYKMLKKVHIYAKFKVTNYKLLRIERDLAANEDDSDAVGSIVTRHFMYESPSRKGACLSNKDREQRGSFAGFFHAVENGDLEKLVELISVRYEHLHTIHKKIQ
ncbi:hypothetical protein ACI3LY_004933 [Candidozyma auris]|uniref:Peptide hydrolase n=2 Tax=Candidozyma auris TaxID=498019 RepID=A0AB36W701_CANAR|nr:hypothetical protein B9J08_002463 [[Candida] auris]PIS55309.1 hypothetical protein CJI97_002007 [[Candida] auris]QWW25790.1 hypothetical protein CA7LBN_004694 [[Candida] auris]